MTETERCVGCGASVAVMDGPVHRYMTAAPGCWALFGRISAEVASVPTLQVARQYMVDAYAVQHPGSPNPQAIQSVAIHLISLFAYLERARPVADAPRLLQRLASEKGTYRWMAPPSFDRSLTIGSLIGPGDVETLTRAAHEWARSAWSAWNSHHRQVEEWFEQYVGVL